MEPPHLLAYPPPPHVLPLMHTPQSIRLPQPSATGPQSMCDWHWKGVQPLQGPQSSVPEQPLLWMPQRAPHVVGVQAPLPHWFACWAPQTWPLGQVPQFRMPPQPSLSVPQLAF